MARAAEGPDAERLDAIVVGGGPAGLSAALVLGRCRRRVLVFDDRRYRNAAALALHGFLSRDGIPPGELVRIGREQLAPYGVELRHETVTDARAVAGGFEAVSAGGRWRAKTLLLAIGVVDRLPAIEGFEAFYGRGVYHCPYCDGWEVRDQPLAVFGHGPAGLAIALSLKTWSDDVMLLTHGPVKLAPAQRQRLARHGVTIVSTRLARLEGADDQLARIVLTDGGVIARRAIFFTTGQHLHSDLPSLLGCRLTHKGVVQTDRLCRTSVPGLYVIGDASPDPQLAVIAAAEGVKAAFAINTALQAEERR